MKFSRRQSAKHPNPIAAWLKQTNQIPFLWETLCERWEEDLNNAQEFENRISELDLAEIRRQEPRWETAYLKVEALDTQLHEIAQRSSIKDEGFLKFLDIVHRTMFLTASVVVNLQVARRKKFKGPRITEREPYLIEQLVEKGKAAIAEVLFK